MNCLLTTFFLLFLNSTWASEMLSKETISKLRLGIVEIVVPKKESKAIKYERPLPYNELPYQLRNDKYFSIGTAFFISNSDLVSAAHVFSPETFSLYNNDYFVRDSSQKVYKVKTVIKYSSRHDLIQFNLESYPPSITPLEAGPAIEIGDTVYSMGNALGEGLAFRAGQIASFTPEVYEGLWKDLRFSTPASPGNSGGPLLNQKGQYVGIIVKKTANENLNYAVPANLIDKLSSSQAIFYKRNISLYDTDILKANITKIWNHQIKLPLSLKELTQKAQKALSSYYKGVIKEYQSKFSKDLFPHNSRLQSYFKEQESVSKIGLIESTQNGNIWFTHEYEGQEIKISPKQALYYSRINNSSSYVYVEKAQNISLKNFITSPKLIIQEILKALPLTRSLAGQRIRITELNSPQKSSHWVDHNKRKWRSYLWYLPHDDQYLYLHCLTIPKGAICLMESGRNEELTYGHEELVQMNAAQMTLAYEGNAKEMAEYLALGDDYIDPALRNVTINSSKSLEIKTPHFSYNDKKQLMNADSVIRFFLTHPIHHEGVLELNQIEFFPNSLDESYTFKLKKVYRPDAFNSKDVQNSWQKLKSDKGIFSGRIFNRMARSNMALRLHKEKDNDSLAHFLLCSISTGDETADFSKVCHDFQAGVVIN